MEAELTFKLLESVNFAAEKHKHQRRKGDNSPYINHPIGVAYLLHTEGNVRDLNALIGGVLHDTVEDTNTTFEELELLFGKKISDIVKDVTDDKSLSKDERKRQQIAHASHCCYEAKLVKLGDKLFNLRDILVLPPKGWSLKRIQGYFVWSKAVIAELRGTNEGLERALDKVFDSSITFNGETHPVIPVGNQEEFLKEYYEDMAGAKD